MNLQQEAERLITAYLDKIGINREEINQPTIHPAVFELEHAVATALLTAEQRGRAQEREQCAEIARSHQCDETGWHTCAGDIGEAIRRGGADA